MRIRRFRRRRCEPLEKRVCLTTFGFAEHVVQPDPTALVGVFDLDGDGDNDILVHQSNELAWRQNLDGKGDFAELEFISSPHALGSFADVDGDGDEDRVSQRIGGLQWYEKLDDAPGFGPAQFIPIEGRVHLKQFGDFDGDGDEDFLLRVVQSEGVVTAFLESHDNGLRFESHQLSFEFESRGIVLADLNNDGDAEIVVQNENVTRVYDIDGDEDQLIAELGNFRPTAAVDYDGDGLIDIVGLEAGETFRSAILFVLENQGDGTAFRRTDEFLFNREDRALLSARAGDFDGDGDVDWITTSIDPWNHSRHWEFHDLVLNAGNGAYTTTPLIQQSTVLIADVTGDGVTDIVFGGGEEDLVVREGGPEPKSTVLSTGTANPVASVVADVDSDGDYDFVIGLMSHSPSLSWFENVGNGRLSDRQDLGVSPNTFFPGHSLIFVSLDLAIHDVDMDGDFDITADANDQYGTYGTAWYLNDGNQEFTTERNHLLRSRSMIRHDVDGDGRIDLLGAVDFSTPELAWRRQLEDGSFGDSETLLSLPAAPWRVVPGDFDADGDEDYLLALSDGTVMRASLDAERNQFTINEESIALASENLMLDLDGDGFDDLVTVVSRYARSEADHVQWYKNESGTFDAPRPIPIGSQLPQNVDFVDLDIDGDLDVVVDGTRWLTNERGVFSPPVTVRIADGIDTLSNPFFGDFDEDGDIDVADRGVWYEQRPIGDSNGDGVFDSADLVTVFQAGKYDHPLPGNATFQEGDWNADGSFDSSDFVFAFQIGSYVHSDPL